jgi:hypothetical protein
VEAEAQYGDQINSARVTAVGVAVAAETHSTGSFSNLRTI